MKYTTANNYISNGAYRQSKAADSGSFYASKAKSNCYFSKDQKKVDQLWDFCQSVL